MGSEQEGCFGNVISGNGYVLDGADNHIRSKNNLTAIVGLDDVAVISTRDAALVLPKARADSVKGLVTLVRFSGEKAAIAHLEISRPWGQYISIDRRCVAR